ncbi:bifunctional DNA primase/polymerase [Streptomyces sp. NPDC101112]|uniref:bifunctional DNA primase/polymerase n=1 Tax=Streptomyces sp. NPDC101112 TaxID=3366105 RepID=UPI003802E3F6
MDAVSTAAAPPSANLTEWQRSTALVWLGRGVPVIPCSRTDKGALVPGFGRDATPKQLAPFSDPEQVRAWWSGRFKRAHVGLLTGRSTTGGRGLVVVDCDMPKDGAQPLEGRWAGCHGGTDVLELLATEAGADFPDTYTVLTPSGGLHLYFEQPDDGPLIGCATGDGTTPPHIGPMVDVRGVGGYVIAAGSYSNAQGRVYERVSAPDVRPQPLPGWLLEILRPAATAAPSRPPLPTCLYVPGQRATREERAAAGALEHSVHQVEVAHEGERNRRLFSSARWLGELHETAPNVLDETTVREQLLAAALRSGQREREALKTIRSGWERGLSGRGVGAA